MAVIDTKKLRRERDELEIKYREALTGYKPKFGNDEDIALVNLLGTIGTKDKMLLGKLDSAKGGASLASEVARLKTQVIEQMKKRKAL